MGTLANRLAEDLKTAMRAGDSVRRDEIRGLLSAIRAEEQSRLALELGKRGLLRAGEGTELTRQQLVEIEEARAQSHLSDDDEMSVLLTRAKQHRQSIDGFQQGGRADLVAEERAQLAILEGYLPRQIEGTELEDAVQAAIREAGASSAREMGRVMGLLSPRLKGRADMKAVSARVQELLAGDG